MTLGYKQCFVVIMIVNTRKVSSSTFFFKNKTLGKKRSLHYILKKYIIANLESANNSQSQLQKQQFRYVTARADVQFFSNHTVVFFLVFIYTIIHHTS
jgi:hypothetical protein